MTKILSLLLTFWLCICPCVQLQNGTRIFDGIAKLIYQCVGWRQQHQHYREKLRLINIPMLNVQEEVHIMKNKSKYFFVIKLIKKL